MISGWLDLIEDVNFDPSVIDLAVWYPTLTWNQLLFWIAAMIAWRLVLEPLERYVTYHTRLSLARGLVRLAGFVRP